MSHNKHKALNGNKTHMPGVCVYCPQRFLIELQKNFCAVSSHINCAGCFMIDSFALVAKNTKYFFTLNERNILHLLLSFINIVYIVNYFPISLFMIISAKDHHKHIHLSALPASL